MEMIKIYTLKEACAELKLAPNLLRAKAKAGEIGYHRTSDGPGAGYRFTENDLLNYVRNQEKKRG